MKLGFGAFIVSLMFLTSSCTTGDSHRRVHISDSDYKSVVIDATKTSQTYDGLVNTIDIRVTLLTSKVREAQTLKKATSFQWSDAEIEAERGYNQKASLTETKIFMSFFTPDSKDDNLSKADTVWRIFLDVGGKRYSGTTSKLLETTSEVRDLYPDHTTWGTPYVVKFLVPTSVVEAGGSRFTITGPVGSTAVEF